MATRTNPFEHRRKANRYGQLRDILFSILVLIILYNSIPPLAKLGKKYFYETPGWFGWICNKK